MAVAESLGRIVRQPAISDRGAARVANPITARVDPSQRTLDVGQFLLDPLE